jgi:hypothetical protein
LLDKGYLTIEVTPRFLRVGAEGQSLDQVDRPGGTGETIDITQVIACGLFSSKS